MRLVYLGLFALVFLIARNTAYTFDRTPNISSIFEQLMQGYDSNVNPNFGGPPLQVQASMYALDIHSVSEKENEFIMEIYFRQYWKDQRLIYKAPMGIQYIPVDAKLMKNIWKPDTFFVNSKYSTPDTTPASTNSFLRIHPNGEVVYSQKMTVTASCIMTITNYPFDTQKCSLIIESYGHTADGIVYSWRAKDNSFGVFKDISTRFRLLGFTNKETSLVLSSGTYSGLVVELYLKRISSFFIINVYIPAILLIIISCLSFLLTSTSTRIIINGLTLFMLLSMTTTSCSTLLSVKAIDVFMLFSILTNVLVLVCHIVSAKVEKPEEAKKDPESGTEKFSISAAFDKYTKIVVPVIYLLGNFIYWAGYCIASSADLPGKNSE